MVCRRGAGGVKVGGLRRARLRAGEVTGDGKQAGAVIVGEAVGGWLMDEPLGHSSGWEICFAMSFLTYGGHHAYHVFCNHTNFSG